MYRSLAKLNEAYQEDAAFQHLRTYAGLTNNFVPGDGPTVNPRLLLIGEAPGAKEQELGVPFIGASGKLLTSMLWELRVHRRDCYVTNVVKYRPPNNRKPTIEEVDDSTPYLRDEVQLVLPKGGIVITLGATALAMVNDEKRVIADHAQPFVQGLWTFVPMAHPSYVLQGRMKRDEYKAAWATLASTLAVPNVERRDSSPSTSSTASAESA